MEGVGNTGKLVVDVGSSCIRIFPPAETVKALQSKMSSAKRVLPVVGVFPLNFAPKTASDFVVCCLVFTLSTHVTYTQADGY